MALNTPQFGSGTLFINPNGGTLAANPTPFRLGVLQDVNVEFKGATEKLWGQNRLPDLVAPSQVEISVKANFAGIQGLVLSQAMLCGTVTAGVKQQVDLEPHSVPASTPYTVTTTNSTTFLLDLGVTYAATGRNLTRVASGPTQGEYSVSAGIYTFAAADAGAGVLIGYVYTLASTGQTFAYQNQKQGVGPTCDLWLYPSFLNGTRGLHLPVSYCTSIGFPTKQKGFVIQPIAFDCADNPGGNAIEWFDIS